MKNIFLIIAVTFNAILINCSIAAIKGEKLDNTKLIDGEYEGSYSKFPNSARVKIIITDGKISNIIFIKHFASPIGYKAESVIPKKIIQNQSTDVDAVSGATNSSRVIMNAVQNAVKKAYKK